MYTAVHPSRRGAWLSIALLLVASALSAQTPDPAAGFEHRNVMIPMRDGVKLNTDHLRARRTAAARCPSLMSRTPYGIDGAAGRCTVASRSWRTTATSSSSRTSAAGTSRRASSS